MPSYRIFAPFYDAVQGDRAEHGTYLRGLIRKHHPAARAILELGCGTGSVIKQLEGDYQMTGVDRSEEMLMIARTKVPHARLVAADMTEVRLGETFDVVLCAYDSINHLLEFEQWEAVFECALDHLERPGIFIFDINTESRLAFLAQQPVATNWFGEGNLLLLDVHQELDRSATWDIKIFESVGGAEYRLHAEAFREISFPVERITAALRERFHRVVVYDQQRARPSARSGRLHFVCTR